MGAVSVDCADPAGLAEFYQNILDLQVLFAGDEFVALRGAGVFLTFQRVVDHKPPNWPDGTVPKQLHLELAVTDLDGQEARMLALGATKADVQPNPDNWRVLIDPAGHPFCITTLMPEVS